MHVSLHVTGSEIKVSKRRLSLQQWHKLRLRWGQRGRLLEVRVLKEGGFACLLGRQHGVRLVRRGHLQSTPNQHASALINPIES